MLLARFCVSLMFNAPVIVSLVRRKELYQMKTRSKFAINMSALLRRHRWLIIGFLWLMAYALGAWGSLRQLQTIQRHHSVFEPFYRALQLFVLEENLASEPPIAWQYQLAMFLAPGVAIYTTIITVASLFQDQLLLVRLGRFKKHVVICGLGRQGFQLVKDFIDNGDRVVVIELNESNEVINTCRDLGAIVLTGNATDPAMLKMARVAYARCIIAICGDDGINSEISGQAHNLMRERWKAGNSQLYGSPDEQLDCYVHIVDEKLRRLFGRGQTFEHKDHNFRLRFFNTFENCAREILDKFPPEADVNAGSQVHLLIIGLGQLGGSVLLQAARIGHYAGGRKLRITIIDREADIRSAEIALRFPALPQICDLRFIQKDVERDKIFDDELLKSIESDHPLNKIYICLDDDAEGLSCALTILPDVKKWNVQVIVRMAQNIGISTLLDEIKPLTPDLDRIRPFHVINSACRREIILNETLDKLAKQVHMEYVADQIARGFTPKEKPNLVDWNELPEEIRESNRQQADHISVKLRAVGCLTRPANQSSSGDFCFTDEEDELLARMEHTRWVADRLLSGWRLGERDDSNRITPYLVEWDQLPGDVKQNDRNAIQKIPAYLKEIGLEIMRK